MPKTPTDSNSSTNKFNPYIKKSINKTLLTPCRQTGLSRKRKTPNSLTRKSESFSSANISAESVNSTGGTPPTSNEISNGSSDKFFKEDTKLSSKSNQNEEKLKNPPKKKSSVSKCLAMNNESARSVNTSVESGDGIGICSSVSSKEVLSGSVNSRGANFSNKDTNLPSKSDQNEEKPKNISKKKKSGSKRLDMNNDSAQKSEISNISSSPMNVSDCKLEDASQKQLRKKDSPKSLPINDDTSEIKSSKSLDGKNTLESQLKENKSIKDKQSSSNLSSNSKVEQFKDKVSHYDQSNKNSKRKSPKPKTDQSLILETVPVLEISSAATSESNIATKEHSYALKKNPRRPRKQVIKLLSSDEDDDKPLTSFKANSNEIIPNLSSSKSTNDNPIIIEESIEVHTTNLSPQSSSSNAPPVDEKRKSKTFKRTLSLKKFKNDEGSTPEKCEINLKKCSVLLNSFESSINLDTLEAGVIAKRKLLNDLQQAEIYKKIHDVVTIERLTAVWKKGCISALYDLLSQMRNNHAEVDMSTLLQNLKIPETMISLSPDGELI